MIWRPSTSVSVNRLIVLKVLLLLNELRLPVICCGWKDISTLADFLNLSFFVRVRGGIVRTENQTPLGARGDVCDRRKRGGNLLYKLLALHKYAQIQSLSAVLVGLSIRFHSTCIRIYLPYSSIL